MTHINKTTANQLAALLIKLDAAIDAHDAVCEQLTAHSIKQGYTREQARPAVVQYVSNKLRVPMNDKGQFVKPTGSTTQWEKARKRVQRILAPIYAESKPRVVNKVDAVEKMLKEFAKLTKAQQRRFMESI